MSEKENANVTTENANVEIAETKNDFRKNGYKKPYNRNKVNGFPDSALKFPEHIRNIAILLKNNAEIRRFTAIGILNYLKQKGENLGDNKYVSFKWNKFAVKANGLMREYSYTEPFFINCFVASFASFSASAQRILNTFVQKEMSIGINKAVDAQEVEDIVSSNEQYLESKEEVSKIED